ncbi:MAG: hypothetical protein M3R52_00755 [Acidobacteriota bacterium]|nr:hypothetical protein [Acidobacteriota bacterium]
MEIVVRVSAVAVVFILALTGCNRWRSQRIETQLRDAMTNPSAVVVIRKDNGFYAIPASGIRNVNNNKIAIEAGTVLAVAFRGNCEGSDDGIAHQLASTVKRLRSEPATVSPSFTEYGTQWRALVRGNLIHYNKVGPLEVGPADDIYVDH